MQISFLRNRYTGRLVVTTVTAHLVFLIPRFPDWERACGIFYCFFQLYASGGQGSEWSEQDWTRPASLVESQV